MVNVRREIIIGTIVIILGFSIIIIGIPGIIVFITGSTIDVRITDIEDILRVFELSYLILFFILILISVFSTKNRVDFVKRIYRFYMIETIIFEVFLKVMTPSLGLYGFFFIIDVNVIFSMIALSFGARGFILQEDENARSDWNVRRGYLILGSIIMVLFITVLSIYLIFFIFVPYFSGLPIEKLSLLSTEETLYFFNRTVSISIYRLSFFLFFISGLSSGRNIRKIKGVKQFVFFIFSLLSLILAFLEGIFNLTFRWPFLFFFSLYFGFFFFFQSAIFFVNTVQASRRNEIFLSRGTLIIMWMSLIWLITVFFIFENLETLTEFPSITMNWAFWIYLCGFCVSFLRR